MLKRFIKWYDGLGILARYRMRVSIRTFVIISNIAFACAIFFAYRGLIISDQPYVKWGITFAVLIAYFHFATSTARSMVAILRARIALQQGVYRLDDYQ